MNDNVSVQRAVTQLADALAAHHQRGVLAALHAMLAAPNTAAYLRALDARRLLTRVFPELEPGRTTEQPARMFCRCWRTRLKPSPPWIGC